MSAVAAGTAAAQNTGSYTLTTFPTPTITNLDWLYNSQTFSPPAGVPSDATVTSISISVDWVPKPNPPGYYSSSTNYILSLCADTANQECINLGPSYNGQNGWTTSNSGFMSLNLNASTQTFHIASALVDSGGISAPYKAAINPSRYVDSKSITVNYTYN